MKRYPMQRAQRGDLAKRRKWGKTGGCPVPHAKMALCPGKEQPHANTDWSQHAAMRREDEKRTSVPEPGDGEWQVPNARRRIHRPP